MVTLADDQEGDLGGPIKLFLCLSPTDTTTPDERDLFLLDHTELTLANAIAIEQDVGWDAPLLFVVRFESFFNHRV